MSGAIWIGLFLLLGTLVLEIIAPKQLKEAFSTTGRFDLGSFSPNAGQNLAANQSTSAPAATGLSPRIDQPNFLTNLLSRRGDVGIGIEQPGFYQDKRYFLGYADVQRYGVKNDFCRMVTRTDTTDSGELYFACALAGTVVGDTTQFRTQKVKDGFRMSRDDYMRDIIGDGRDAYCRILKAKDGTYLPHCRRAQDTGFSDKDEIDPEPPEEIKTLMDFYSGCELWFRLRDDMLDYMERCKGQVAGGTVMDHTPNPTVAKGMTLNGIDQYVRFGDNDELSLGNRVKMRSVRAFSVWVKFEAFTNNAHIFDFGDGAGINNVFLGILGKGDGGDDGNELRPGAKCPETTIPDGEVGAQFCPEMRPQTLYETSAAAVEKWECKNPSVLPRKMEPIQTKRPAIPSANATRATLIYEVWDQKLRKVQIKVNRAIPLGEWTHILIAAKNSDAMRPDLNVIINGNLVYTQEQGYLPQAKLTSHNYFGKSNWANDSSEYELRDELFKGAIFDFRMYSSVVSETKGKRILQWGMRKLGLDNSYASTIS
jgi:hypothetical protein